MQRTDGKPVIPADELFREELLDLAGAKSLGGKLCKILDRDVDVFYLIPRCLVDDTGLGQPENSLERPHRFGGVVAVESVCGVYLWDSGVVVGDTVQFHLNGADFVAGAAEAQR